MKKNLIAAITGVIMLLSAFGALAQVNAPEHAIKKGMIKVAILYPSGEGNKFDMDYYTTKHFPLLRTLFGDDLKATAIDKGIGSSAPGSAAPFVAAGYLYFDKLADFQNGMKTHGNEIRGDIPKYTNIKPVILVSEVLE